MSERTCAVVLEPIQGESGVLPADQAYLEGVRELCNEHGALLIFDEVQTGMGRTGDLFAYMHSGVVPDILTNAKSLGGGFPIGAMLTTHEIAAHLSVGTHGTTYGGNPLACAVAETVVDIVNTSEVLEGVKQRHALFRTRLEAIGERYGVFRLVRGRGLLIGCVLSDAWKGKAAAFCAAAEREALMILQAGPDVLRLAPSLIIEIRPTSTKASTASSVPLPRWCRPDSSRGRLAAPHFPEERMSMSDSLQLILEDVDGTQLVTSCTRFAVMWQGREVWIQQVGNGQLMIGVDVEEGDTEYANLLLRPLATNLVSLQLEMEPVEGEDDEHVHGPDCNH